MAIVLPAGLSNTTLISTIKTTFNNKLHSATGTDPVRTATGDLWTLAVARGAKLLQGMRSSDAEAAALYSLGTTAESPFDGDLVAKLREWGYNDANEELATTGDEACDFDDPYGHSMKRVFDELAIGTKSMRQGGQNQCFQIEHSNGPAVKKDENGKMPELKDQRYEVCGKEYRSTGASFNIGANSQAGAIYGNILFSPARNARSLWEEEPPADALPAIRSVSDMAWAVWNRVHTNPREFQNIRYLFVMQIINGETRQHVKRARRMLSPPKGEVPDPWPGNDFSMETDAGKALLGSPVGRWAGYFLMQHKRRLGGNKIISKVRVFKAEEDENWPYFLFYVAGTTASAANEEADKNYSPHLQPATPSSSSTRKPPRYTPAQSRDPTYTQEKMDSLGGGGFGNADLSKLSDRDKQELQQFAMNEGQKARIQSSIHSLTDTCFRKCIPAGTVKAGKLDKYEEPCMRQCVDRFLDANMVVLRELERLRG
ncbi:uncharacterized protein J4E88_010066 [Alternaria novae-zelandiae]|uniref:uncharacterized protein n=1 Tax=Alternaria novae-zelandiae TaxID=430562 RepID=UPI0020C5A38A|nr:uncharacterized protein J4E88_010066 [Alternaria novae-zelandiae]KAI4667815.1 hypothetical protein J4E88_010066 [Alternaria novae-zelandiae]